MKRKIFTLLFAVVFVGGLIAQDRNNPRPLYVVKKATVAPTVDGTTDAMWDTIASATIELPFFRNSTDPPSYLENPTLPGENYFKVLYDDLGVYILLHSEDDVFQPGLETNTSYMNDKPELYFDCNAILHNKAVDGSTGHTAGHWQVAPEYHPDFYTGGLQTGRGGAGVNYAHVVDQEAVIYNWEYFMPWEFLVDAEGMAFNQADTMGFDVTLIDNDIEVDATRDRMVWSNDNYTTEGTADESWSASDGLGYFVFEGGVAPPITYVTAVTIGAEDNVITTDGGTLQFDAVVDPADATNPALNWTLIGSGAILNASHLLTAQKNGTVWVVATARDGSGVADTFEITISGQIYNLTDANLLKNAGTWDNVPDGAGHPALWEGWLDGATGSTAEMVGGVYKGYSAATFGVGQWWHFQFLQNGNTQGWAIENGVPYIVMFDAWAESERTGYVDFEDADYNGYTRVGVSMSPDAINPSGGDIGRAGWVFSMTSESKTFTYDMVGDGVQDDTRHQIGFMMSSDSGVFFLDNMYVVKVADLPVYADSIGFVLTTGITVTGAAGATSINSPAGTLQMSAAVAPENANLKNVYWSVVNGTGAATIDKTGLLTAVTDGLVTVKATAFDGGSVGTLEVTIQQVGVKDFNARSFRMYPNPVVDVLNVDTKDLNANVAIYNSVGQKVAAMNSTNNQARFDVRGLAQGVYFVRVNNGAAEKFVK